MDKLIEKVVIDGVEFEIIQKPTTWYVGYKADADSMEGESNDAKLRMDNELFEVNHKNVKNSLTPDFSNTYPIEYWQADGSGYASISVFKA